ncbi:hypothetical protein FOL47_010988 [Perkinsus chesapeaki]|uniref:Polycystin cation channel PKD1/PKD2 domain-containing protein n=1 Tax=Perkinsus chesapeaki TaxID=330153 RepID=A0A7J6MNJ9_PERCH|nr:hypothetical protein FOL47_010988 [Perkinsus chesapeaki]
MTDSSSKGGSPQQRRGPVKRAGMDMSMDKTNVVPRKQLLAYVRKQKEIMVSCQYLPFAALFWVAFVLVSVMHGSVEVSYQMTSSVESMVESVSFTRPVAPSNDTTGSSQTVPQWKTGDVGSYDDIWLWLKDGLLPALMSDGRVRYYNELVGGVRLLQERSAIENCDDEVMGPIYTFPADEDSKCHPLASISRQPIADQVGRFGFEPSTEGHFEYYIDGSRGSDSLRAGQATIDRLASAQWLDLSGEQWAEADRPWITLAISIGTKLVKVEAILFNGETNMFLHVAISFEVQRGGAIIPKTTARTLVSTVYNSMADYVIDLIWLVLIAYLVMREAHQIYMVRRIGRIRYYLTDFWSFVDWMTIFGGIGVGIFYAYLAQRVSAVKEDIVEISDLGDTISPSELDSLTPTVYTIAYYERGQPRLAVITDTMKRAWMDVAYFLIVFCTVFFNFVLGGYTLFGKRLKGWSTPGDAINTAFVALMGDFDYVAMRRVAPISAAIWFWFYMVLVFLIMLNMLLAIVMDTYTSVKDEACAAEMFTMTPGDEGSGAPKRKFLESLGFHRSSIGQISPGEGGVSSYALLDRVMEALEPSGFHVRDLLDLENEAKTRERRASQQQQDASDLVTLPQLMSIGLPLEDARRLIQGARNMFGIGEDELIGGGDDDRKPVSDAPPPAPRHGRPSRMQLLVNQLVLNKNKAAENDTEKTQSDDAGVGKADIKALTRDIEYLKDRVAMIDRNLEIIAKQLTPGESGLRNTVGFLTVCNLMSMTSSTSSPPPSTGGASPSSLSASSRTSAAATARGEDQPSSASETELTDVQSRVRVSVVRKNRRKKSEGDAATFVLGAGDKLVIEVDRDSEGTKSGSNKNKRPRTANDSVKNEKSTKRSSSTKTPSKSKSRRSSHSAKRWYLNDLPELVEARLVIHREDTNLPAIRKNDFKIWTGQPLQTQIVDVLKRGLYRDASSWHCEFDKEGVRGKLVDGSQAPLNIPGFEPGITIVVKPACSGETFGNDTSVIGESTFAVSLFALSSTVKWALDLPCELQDPIAFRDQYRTTRQAALGALANVKEKDGLVDEVPTEEINRRLMESIVSAQANIVVARRECAYLRQHRNAGHRHHRDGSSSAERRTQNIERTVLQGEQQSSDLKDLTGSPQSIPSKTCVHLDDAVQIREFNAFEPSEKPSHVSAILVMRLDRSLTPDFGSGERLGA